MKRAIVTGATGFVGSNLCRHLVECGFKVSIILRPSSDYLNIKDMISNIEILEYDGNINSLIGYLKHVKADVIYHLASFAVVEHRLEHVDTLLDSNIRFGLHILEAMRVSGTKLLINTGTSWQHYQSEDYNPVDLYAATKQAFECLLKYYTEIGSVRNITLKLFDTYGEMDIRPKLINLIRSSAMSGELLKLSPGEQSLDLVHVNDVVNAFTHASEYLLSHEDVKNAQFGVGSGRKITVRELIRIFESVTGRRLNVCLGGVGYRKREVMVPWNSYKTLPGWECKITLEEGIKRLALN